MNDGLPSAPRPNQLWRLRLQYWLAIAALIIILLAFAGIGGVIGWRVRGSDDLLEARAEIQANRAAIERNRAAILLRASPAEWEAIQSTCPLAGRPAAAGSAP